MTIHDTSTTWHVAHQATTGPRQVVYTIGHAGSGAAAWVPVARLLRDDTELRAIRFPGRERRVAEPPLRSVDEQVDDLAPRIAGRAAAEPVPYVLVGVCSGAITAFELCRRLLTSGTPPAGLVVVCQAAPAVHAGDDSPPVHSLPGPQLRALLAEQGGIPPFISEHEDMFSVFEPFLRADCEAAESYVHRPEPPLGCPVVAVLARDDEFVDRDDVLAWATTTRNTFSAVESGGTHNMLISEPAELATALGTALDLVAGPSRAGTG